MLDLDNSKTEVVLPPGSAATAKITAAKREDVLRAPDEALDVVPHNIAPPPVLPAGQGRVWVLRDGKPSPKVVKLGLDDGRYSEILEGELKPGDRVLMGRN
ncbi:MAG: hypothetical protein WBS22_04660 [Methylocystis sp.]